MATPASASALGWGEDTATKYLKGNADTANRVLANTDILDMTVNGSTIYAATADNASATINALYKSTDGGVTWTSLLNTTDYPTTKPVKKVVVAKDDAKAVAILTTDSTVYYSSDGGSSWQNAGIPGTTGVISDIDLSAGTSKYIAAGGMTAAGVAELWVLKATGGLGTGWDARYSTANGAQASQYNIYAVKVSANFASDKVIAVVSSNATTDNGTSFQVFHNDTTFKWNGSINTSYVDAGWATGSGVALATLGSAVVGADIALVPTFLGNDASTLDAFIALAAATAPQGNVYHVAADITKTNLTVTGGSGSLAYNATSGALLAGSWTSNKVNRFLNPLATSPTREPLASLQQPSGQNHTLVAWVGDNVAAGTSGDESAFALSMDAGKTFNDAGLIDTVLTTISDIAVNAAGSKIYMTTYDVDDVSIWLKTTSWNRVLSFRDYAGGAYKFLVRIAPENDAVVYVAAQGVADTTADNMWVSKDSGTTWSTITNSELSVKDFAVLNATTVYTIDTAGLSKSTNSGASWGDKVLPASAIAAFSITLAPNTANSTTAMDVLIGGSDGYIAFSKDAGATLTRTQITAAGNVLVVADKDYATNNFIYASTGAAVYRGKADATSSFSARSPTFDVNYTSPIITGLVRDGAVIYALSTNGTVSALSQALNMTTTVASGQELWSTIIASSSTGVFGATPQSLKLVSGNVLWTINTGTYSTTSKTILSYTNTNAVEGPGISGPVKDYLVPVNVTTGKAYNVSFAFTRPAGDTSGNTINFQLQIATDNAFGGLVYDHTFTDIDEATETRIIGPTGDTGMVVDFMPDTTYYWRIRVAKSPASTTVGTITQNTGTLQSQWSETRTLKIAKTAPAVAPIPFDIVSPIRGANDVPINAILTWTRYDGAIGYEVALATDPTFAIIDFSHNVSKDNLFYASEPLAYSTTYYWRVRGVTGPAPAKAAAPGGPWVTGAFTTMADPAKAVTTPTTPQIIIQKEPAPPPEIKVIEVPVQTPAPIPSYLLWIIIIIGAVLIIALIVLIARTRRVA
jgi:hypothetical protein